MFRKMLVASTVLAASTSVVFAHHHRAYKGEVYKDVTPCPVYQFMAGPYIGLSVGPQINTTGTPTVYRGLEGTLSLGYAGMITPMFYLAGEIFGGDSIDLKNLRYNVTGVVSSVKSTWSYGLDLIPGLMITDYVMGYVRVGGVRTRFSDQGQSASAWQVGVGAQTSFMQNWDVRGEYIYSQYGRVNGIGKPMIDQFNLGVVYKFL